VIDKIKEVIKASPKAHPAMHKFFALKLLNKVILKKNPEVNLHVQSTMMNRLATLALFNNDKDEKSA